MKRFIHTITIIWRYIATHRRLRYSLLAVFGLFVVVNVIVFALYNGRTYPKTSIANQIIGSISYDKLATKIDTLHLLPDEVTFVHDKTKHTVKVSQLGVTLDTKQQSEQLKAQRSWLPLANLFASRSVPLSLDSRAAETDNALKDALDGFRRDASDARIIRQNGAFTMQADQAGHTVDLKTTEQRLLAALSVDKTAVAVSVLSQPADMTAAELQPQLNKLRQQTQTGVELRYAGKTKKFSAAEIAGWYNEENSSFALSDTTIQTAVRQAAASWGIRAANAPAASQAIIAGLTGKQAVNFDLEAAPAGKRLTYCTAVRGVDTSELPALEAKLTETFRDTRGWGLEGLVQFDKVASGCDFTVWLTAADQMPSFGAICDADWSCMVPPNVVINHDRWRNASTAWNNQGGSLEDYRAMVINHETGHWLGFYHSDCPGSGQQAPVMQQQSIDLQGCSFNPWPTAGERATLQRKFGL